MSNTNSGTDGMLKIVLERDDSKLVPRIGINEIKPKNSAMPCKAVIFLPKPIYAIIALIKGIKLYIRQDFEEKINCSDQLSVMKAP
jgi:hypothetical protein